jgi:hypothetical protein
MLLLTSVTDKLQIITGQGIAIDVHSSWVDSVSNVATPGRTNIAITTATTTDIVASPGASIQRNVQTLNIRNKDATLSCDVTVLHTDGTIAVQLFKMTLPAGNELQYVDGAGWMVYTSSGFALTSGSIGPSGLPGSQGIPGNMNFWQDNSGEDEQQALWTPTGLESRNQLAPDAKNWSFLGTATGAAVTVGPVIWTGEYRQLMIKYFIVGSASGTPVGRILLGSAAISTTALTNSFSVSEGVAAPTTGLGATAVPGCPLATTLSLIGRGGWIFVDGVSGAVKELIIEGRNVTPAIASAPTLFRGASFFSDLGTNLLIQRAQLTNYDTLVATAASAIAFSAGTYLTVWGRMND